MLKSPTHAIPTLVAQVLNALPVAVRLSVNVQLDSRVTPMLSASVEIVNMIMNAPAVLPALTTTAVTLVLEPVAATPTVRCRITDPSVHVHKDSLAIH